MHTFSPTIAIVISINWGNLFSSQVRDYHRKQTGTSPGFDIQGRLMGVNTQLETNFSSPSILWKEWTTDKPGCYDHLWPDSVPACSNAASPATASLQSSLSSMKNILHLIQALMLGYSLGKAAQACLCDRPHVTAAVTDWHQGRSKVHLLLRILRNQHHS